MTLLAALLMCYAPVVTDGDSIRCASGVRLRLAGIDAPDKPAYCKRKGRVCTIEQWRASRDSLKAAILGQGVLYKPVQKDLYRRTVATVYADGKDLSCVQIKSGNALYVAKWNGRAINCKGA